MRVRCSVLGARLRIRHSTHRELQVPSRQESRVKSANLNFSDSAYFRPGQDMSLLQLGHTSAVYVPSGYL
ncbi:hypothetical protein DENSPDRAFT_298023 [Dentipellis sp. KUC8613]|nr:hypothetical protein DENSPDRAFT_298023 [Dentipellis sp. KUC8613]